MEENQDWNSQEGHDPVSEDLQRRTILAVLCGLIGVGAGIFALFFAGTAGGMVWLGFSVLAVGLLFFLLRYFELGIVGFICVCWIAYGTPTIAQGGSGGGAQSLKISQAGLVVLLAVWAIRRLLQLRRGFDFSLYKTPITVPILLYLVICIWSTGNSLLFPNQEVLAHGPRQFFQVNALEVLMRLLSLGGLLMIGNSLQGRTLKAGAYAIIAPGILTFTGVQQYLHLPISAYQAFPQILAMAVLAATVLTGDWTRTWVRVISALLVIAIVFVYFVRGAEWVSGWLGALSAVALITFTAQRKLFWLGVAAVFLIVVCNFNYFYETVYASNFYGAGPTHDVARVGHMGTFTNDRTRMWGAAVKYASYFPLGIGLGNYRSYNMYFGRVDVWNTTTFTSAHGTYSQALSETGWLGLFALLYLIYTSCRMLRHYYRALPPGPAKTYMLGAWGGCVGIFCASFNGDYIFPTYHNGGVVSFGACVYTWMIIGVCVAIARQHGLVWSELEARAAEPKQQRRVAPIYSRPPFAPERVRATGEIHRA